MREVEQERRWRIQALVGGWDEDERAGLAQALIRLNASLGRSYSSR